MSEPIYAVGQVLYLPLRVNSDGTVVPTGNVHKPVIEIKQFTRTWYTFDISTTAGQRMIAAWPEDALMEVNPLTDTKQADEVKQYVLPFSKRQYELLKDFADTGAKVGKKDGWAQIRDLKRGLDSSDALALEEKGYIKSMTDDGIGLYKVTDKGHEALQKANLDLTGDAVTIRENGKLVTVRVNVMHDTPNFDIFTFARPDETQGEATRLDIVHTVDASEAWDLLRAVYALKQAEDAAVWRREEAEKAEQRKQQGLNLQRAMAALGIEIEAPDGPTCTIQPTFGKNYEVTLYKFADLKNRDQLEFKLRITAEHLASDGQTITASEYTCNVIASGGTADFESRVDFAHVVQCVGEQLKSRLEHYEELLEDDTDQGTPRSDKTRFVIFDQYDEHDVTRAEHEIDKLRRDHYRVSGITGDERITVMMTKHIKPDGVKRKQAQQSVLDQVAEHLGDDLDGKAGEPANTEEKMIVSHEPVGVIDAEMFSQMLSQVALNARRLPIYNDHRVTADLLKMSARFSTVAKKLEEEGVLSHG